MSSIITVHALYKTISTMNQWQYSYVLELMMGHTCVLSIWTSTTYLGGLMLERKTFLVWFLSVFTTRASPLTISTTYIIKLFKSQFCEFLCNMFIMIILQQRINTQKIPCLRWYTFIEHAACLKNANLKHLSEFFPFKLFLPFQWRFCLWCPQWDQRGSNPSKALLSCLWQPYCTSGKKKFLIYAQITRGWY